MRAKLIYALLLAAFMMAQVAAALIGAESAKASDVDANTVRESEADKDGLAIGPVRLNPIVEVDNDYIRVGDIFANAGKAAPKKALRTPQPGEEVTLNAVWLWKLARAHRLEWRPSSKHDIAIASRKSRVIGRETISRAISDALLTTLGEDDLLEHVLDDPSVAIYLPMRVEPTMKLERFRYDAATGRFSGVILAPADGRTLEKRVVAGRVHRMADVAVPTARISKGQVIRKRDLEIIRFRAEKLGQNIVADPGLVVGMAAKRSLRAGKPIRTHDIHPPILVQKGDRVTVVFQTDRMVLTTLGRAMENGAAGETIRIQNTQSHTMIDAEVISSNRVAVRPISKIALN